eukprot:TRINITY_DN3468_c0_g1_i1.p1 TRINITY_DN3468_c0_g1~~TRINITY_DN3468_c0_g1_i1.p1  ORF type:complete len:291 (-),score=87.46 TRINITY_DN3468_c0_g1_i1:95-967(-)
MAQNNNESSSLSFDSSLIKVSFETTSTGLPYAIVELNHKPVNSLDTNFLQEIIGTFTKLHLLFEQDKCYGAVIRTNLKVFSAGIAFNELYYKTTNEQKFKVFWTAFQEVYKTLYLSPLFVISEISGSAIAGGCFLTLCCDHRIMLDNPKVKIGLNETLLGLSPPKWLASLFCNTIGVKNGVYHLQHGTLFEPKDAKAIGLVDTLVSDVSQLREASANEMNSILSKTEPNARSTVKNYIRLPLINAHLLQNGERKKDLDSMYAGVNDPRVIKYLSKVLQMLKSKRKPKSKL